MLIRSLTRACSIHMVPLKENNAKKDAGVSTEKHSLLSVYLLNYFTVQSVYTSTLVIFLKGVHYELYLNT